MNQSRRDSERAGDASFDRTAGYVAIAGAVVSFAYAVAFVAIGNQYLYSTLLMVGGLLSAVALLGVYQHVRAAGPLATVGLLFGFAGTLGAAVHGAFDLAVAVHPFEPALHGPNPIDPRGFLTFGVAGLGVILLSWAGLQTDRLRRNLLYLGLLFGVLSIAIYLARLIVLDAGNILVLGPAALAGVIVGPAWYAWVGYELITGGARR